MFACVTDDVEHRVNEGGIRRGRALFAEFCAHMGVSYRETLADITIFTTADPTRAAAEFTVRGEYLQTGPRPAAGAWPALNPACRGLL